MAWIEVHQELYRHPKVQRLATALQKNYAETLGHLISLWLWAAAFARDGDVTDFTSEEIAEACNAKDSSDIEKLLIECHWIDQKGAKKHLHDWKKHGLRVLESSRKRQAKARRSKVLDENPVTQQSRDGDALLSYLSILSNPSILSTPAFAAAWNDWCSYRRERRKPIRERAALMQLRFLASQTDPIAIIEQSIRNEWQGLFELKGGSGGQVKRNYKFDRTKYPTLPAEEPKP